MAFVTRPNSIRNFLSPMRTLVKQPAVSQNPTRRDILTASDQSKSKRACARIAGFMFLLVATCSPAVTVVWSGASGTDTNWSTAANWTGGTPASGNDMKFFNPGAAATTNSINNFVDASVTVASLQFGNTNFTGVFTNAHTTLIPAGVTLALTGTGGLSAGTGNSPRRGNCSHI